MSNENNPSKPDVEPKLVHHDEEIIHVPEGRSKARWIMLILLVMLLLTTFTVGDEVVKTLTGEGKGSKAFLRWNHPTEGLKKMTQPEFLVEKQNYNKLFSMLRMNQNSSKDRTDDETATYLVLADVSERAGVHITNEELKKFILNRFGNAQNYQAIRENYRITAKDFEETLRRALCVERYEALLSSAVGAADPAEIEKAWKNQHQEYAFDYIELPVANVMEEAKAKPVTDEELKAYYDALPQARKDSFKTPARIAAEVVGIGMAAGVNTDLLFAKFPRPPAEDADLKAKEYYDDFSFSRFRNQHPNLQPGKQPTQKDLILPFEEVKEAAKREARIYASLSDWVKDISAREAKGEPINVAGEATALGLSYHQEPKALEADAWRKLGVDWLGSYTVASIFDNGASGKLLPAIVLDEASFTFARVITKDEPLAQSYDDVKETLRDEMLKKRATDLAKSKLEALRDKFGTRPAADDKNAPTFKPVAAAAKFAEVAKEAGFEAKLRDYKERFAPPPPEGMSAVDSYLRMQSPAYTEKAGTVLAAALDPGETMAYLVRVNGLRDGDVSKMKIADMQNLMSQTSLKAKNDFRMKAFSSTDYLKEHYGLELESWKTNKQSE